MIKEKKNGQRSHHHRDNEIKQIFQEIETLNVGTKKKPRNNLLRNILLITLVVMLGALLFVVTNDWLGGEISGHTITEEPTETVQDPDGYYGAVLMSIQSDRQVYRPGETLVMQAEISSDIDRNANVTYELYDDQQKMLYSYTHEKTLTQENRLQKKLLLTENYGEGEYFVELKAKFQHEGIKYVLPGRTKFLIEKEPWTENLYLAQGVLLLLIILLNITLAKNAFRND
ncbi:hypothetical protein ACFL0V_01680 [Nanoarchaeota archaeon]